MTSPKYTKGKLRVATEPGVSGVFLEDENGKTIGVIDGVSTFFEQDQTNAARLALCWNCHDDLVKALETALEEMGEEPHLPPCSCGECVTIRQIKQALADSKAEGK